MCVNNGVNRGGRYIPWLPLQEKNIGAFTIQKWRRYLSQEMWYFEESNFPFQQLVWEQSELINPRGLIFDEDIWCLEESHHENDNEVLVEACMAIGMRRGGLMVMLRWGRSNHKALGVQDGLREPQYGCEITQSTQQWPLGGSLLIRMGC